MAQKKNAPRREAAPATLEAKGLKKTFHGRQVLKGVDLQVCPGELTVIVGRSGCGKSTFLRCLNGLEVFDEGTLTFG
ncbi:MAG TPA: ATP-binding cassette domain-containing protein, partial [Elusimicrobiota bacterium]|nr:ATP-binding cassette domain-containing protein [Elusimicrobiota bacterium]